MSNYWSTKAVPIPADAYRNRNDGRVYIYIKVSVSEDRQDDRRIVIGKLVSEEENTFPQIVNLALGILCFGKSIMGMIRACPQKSIQVSTLLCSRYCVDLKFGTTEPTRTPILKKQAVGRPRRLSSTEEHLKQIA